MESLIIPAIVALIAFIGCMLVLFKLMHSDEEKRKQSVVDKLSFDAQVAAEETNLTKERMPELPRDGFIGILASIPGVRSTYDLLWKANLRGKRLLFMLCVMVLFVALFIAMRWLLEAQVMALCAAGAITFFATRKFLMRRINSRKEAFLHLFPDATDVMVRSVRSGHPLNVAMRMVAENMDDPVRSEFKEVINQVACGMPLTDALRHMSYRINSQDVHFFVVVLTVQQETGGSLSEILSNLSGMLRKRKQLRLKINALTSEGRATAWILGSLPLMEFVMLKFIAGDYVQPMLTTVAGNILLGIAVCLVILAVTIVRNMANAEV